MNITNAIIVETYGVFNTVPTKPPMAPDTKLFISCACGLLKNDKLDSDSGQKYSTDIWFGK